MTPKAYRSRPAHASCCNGRETTRIRLVSPPPPDKPSWKKNCPRGLLPYFDYVLGGDRIARSKPAPDIYETACRALHAVPADTYAIEDSYNGIRAAHAAGMRPIMVPDLLPPTQEMYTLAAHIFPNLTAFHEFLKRQ